jgi:primosomal protein N' (replication factor Y) (superfamily II helicase)
MDKRLIKVAVPGTPRILFTYVLPDIQDIQLTPGRRLFVPLGKRRTIGYYMGPAEIKPDVKLKSVIDIVDQENLFEPKFFEFLNWMADYYYANPADVFNAALPPGMRKSGKSKIKNKNTITGEICLGYKIADSATGDTDRIAALKSHFPDGTLFQKADAVTQGISNYKFRKLLDSGDIVPIYGLPDLFDYIRPRSEIGTIKPNKEQKTAIDNIVGHLSHYAPMLLYGITGSGKTLVYCQAVREVLKQNRTALVLVPEIALAGTLLSYFKSFFREKIALMHSGLKPKERVLVWQNIRNGRYKIVIGARSALFAPLKDLGLIIVDEEHDESYKQDDPAPRFQARDAAVMRARMNNIPIVLGSASPSVESFYNAQSGRYQLMKLTRRPEKAEIPVVRLVDLKREWPVDGNPFFTRTLISKVKASLGEGSQVILYLNRRGFSPRIKCTECGFTPNCPHCDISLTYHRKGNRLVCHYCGYINPSYNSCAQCGGDNFLYIGTGTQKIEDNLVEVFSDAKVVRLDSDNVTGRAKAHIVLSEFAARKYNLLLGTQMVTKGIDFPDVSLVGVLMADIGMDMPDFRASEKLFAKLIQVAGRSGRGIIPGEVIIQTFNPDTDLIDDAARQDYDMFYGREIKSRQSLQYPPFSHLINFRFSAKKEDALRKHALDFKNELNKRLEALNIKAHLLGPAPCPLYRMRGMFRRHMFAKTRQIIKFIKLLDSWQHDDNHFALPSTTKLIIDIDPYDMM